MPDIRTCSADIEIGTHYLEGVSAHFTVEADHGAPDYCDCGAPPYRLGYCWRCWAEQHD